MNIHVVRATATALIKANPSSSQHLRDFSMGPITVSANGINNESWYYFTTTSPARTV